MYVVWVVRGGALRWVTGRSHRSSEGLFGRAESVIECKNAFFPKHIGIDESDLPEKTQMIGDTQREILGNGVGYRSLGLLFGEMSLQCPGPVFHSK